MPQENGDEAAARKAYIGRVHRLMMFFSGVVLFLGAIAAGYVFFYGSAHPPKFLFR